MTDTLDNLAERYGIATSYKGLDSVVRAVPDATKISILEAMGVTAASEAAIAESLGQAPDPDNETEIPEEVTCFRPSWLENGRCWGIAIQLYALRSARNWGIGDFADLMGFCRTAAASGADFVALNPLHALFLGNPDRRSPFSPSSRKFLNPLYIAVDAVPGFASSMIDEEALATARETELVDYPRVTALKLSALRQVFQAWSALDIAGGHYSRAAFGAFKAAHGKPLADHALFETLSLAMVSEGHGAGWQDWPSPYQDARGAAVFSFASANAAEVDFQCWLQWLASVQLLEVKAASRRYGMRIGLYLDLAVGVATDGSTSWSDPALTMRDVHIGAPPDYFSLTGQDWALAPFAPSVLRTQNLAPFGEVISALARYAGAIRIDHAMGIRQLFLVPAGQSPAQGTYVSYPTAGMVGVLSAISRDNETVVIGEDLGNVPEGFRDLMAKVDMLSYRILYFERTESGFIAPEHYPRESLACLSTHDLPTIEGWWRGEDIGLRRAHDLIDDAAVGDQVRYRAMEREQLIGHLVWLGLLSHNEGQTGLEAAHRGEASLPVSLIVAIHRFLGRTSSRLLAVRLEDLVGEREPVNLPGTVASYPNWQRKLPVAIETIEQGELFGVLTKTLASERPKPA